MFVNTKLPRILRLVTLHKSHPSSLPCQQPIEGVRKGALWPWSWVLLVFLFSQEQTFLIHCPLGKLKPPPSNGRKIGQKWGNGPTGIRHCISTILDRSALGKGDTVGNPHPPGLNLGFGTGNDALSRRSWEARVQMLSPTSRYATVNILGSPRLAAFFTFWTKTHKPKKQFTSQLSAHMPT